MSLNIIIQEGGSMKNKLIKYLGLFLIVFLSITNVYATEITTFGESVDQKGKYESSRFAAGNIVNNKAEIDGLSFAAGNEVTLEGKVSYGFYAGNIVTVKELVEKDAFIAGNSIRIEEDAILSRDVYIAGNTVTVKSNIKRDLRAGGSTIDLRGITIDGNADLAFEKILLDEGTEIKGKLSYPSNADIKGLDDAKIGKIKKYDVDTADTDVTVKDKIVSFIIGVFASIITGLVLFLIIPNTKIKLDNLELNLVDVFKNIGIGLLVLIVTPIVALIGLFTGILTPISLITIVIYIISIYLTGIVVSYKFGNMISNKLFKVDSMFLSLFVGIVLVKLLKMVPVIGDILSIFVVLYGMGLIFKYIKDIRKDNELKKEKKNKK